MADDTLTTAITEYVAMCNDQTDGLIEYLANHSNIKDTDPWFAEAVTNHMRLLQRSLAKATVSEIEWMEKYIQLMRAL